MSVWSILLRLFLAAALIFNGAATAVASVHMSHVDVVQAAVQPEPVSAEDPPCHGHDPATAAVTDLPVAVDTDSDQGTSPDCCESGACRCSCAQHATATILDLRIVAPIIEHAASVRPMSSGHAAPALPHLIRPPIG